LVWKYIPEFSDLQFPWRWLTFSGLSVSILAGYLFANSKVGIQKSASIFILPFLIISSFLIYQVSYFRGEEINDWKRHSGVFAPIEYRPVWLNNPVRILPPVEKAAIIKGSGSVKIIDWKSNQHILSTSGETDLRLKLSTFYYPGWKAKIDGKESSIIIDAGSMLLEVPKGRHKVEFMFQDTPVRYYGKVISIISLFIVVFIYLFRILRYFYEYSAICLSCS